MVAFASTSFARPADGGIPGPPFMPTSSTKTDLYDPRSKDNQVLLRNTASIPLDRIGQAIVKTIPNAIQDQRFAFYFCQANLDKLQKMVAEKVEEMGGYKIERQNDSQMLILMRNVYMTNPKATVDELNRTVSLDAAKNILSNIKFSNIHLDLKRSSFNPLAYGVSDVGSIRGV